MAATAFGIEVRPAIARDVRLCGAPPYLASSDDGSAAVFVDGDLVAVADEYGTAYLRPGSNATPTKGEVESFLQAAMDFHAAGR